MSFTENPDDLLPLDGPNVVTATYKSATIRGIFEGSFVEQLRVQTSALTFLTSLAYVPAAAQGDTITIGATTYTVVEVHEEPEMFSGWVVLYLKA